MHVLEALLSGILLQLLLLISGVVAARLLGPADRGLLALIWLLTMTVVHLGCLGVPTAVTYELAKGDVRVRGVFEVLRSTVLLQVLVQSGVLAAALVVLMKVIGLPQGPALVALVAVPAMVTQTYCLAAIQGSGALRSLHALRLMPVAAYALSLVVGTIAGGKSLMFVTTAWVASFVFSAVLTTLAAHHLARARDDRVTEGRTPSRRAMVRFGFSGLLGYVSPTETFRLDQLIVGMVLSVYDLGLYVAVLAFCNLPRFLAQALGLVSFPAIAGASDQVVRRRLLWKFVALGTGAAAVVVAPLMLFAHGLLVLAFGPQFAPGATTLQILLAGTVVLCARRLIADGLRGAGAPGAGSVAEMLSWLWLVPALAILVPLLGLPGVAIALSSSYVVTTVLLVGSAQRRGLGLRRRLEVSVTDARTTGGEAY